MNSIRIFFDEKSKTSSTSIFRFQGFSYHKDCFLLETMVWQLEVFSTNQRFPLLLPAPCDSCFDRLVFLIKFVVKTTISGNQINDFTCRKNKGEAENTDSTTPLTSSTGKSTTHTGTDDGGGCRWRWLLLLWKRIRFP
ncbi:unnamed protein product [Lactuca virosa]|uniref:Uncharacterized protein n=1 Tax=Lactuca virosa TaxID=75947 RepID=A0AAU9PN62_9ASTR|nr:unnamed protein product [Lactuca virosa]